MRVQIFGAIALLGAIANAATLPEVCDEQMLAQISSGAQEDVNLCSISQQLQSAQKEKEDTATDDLKKASEALAKARASQTNADQAKKEADDAQAKADALAGST